MILKSDPGASPNIDGAIWPGKLGHTQGKFGENPRKTLRKPKGKLGKTGTPNESLRKTELEKIREQVQNVE